jgi:phosphohistidine phosphatase
MRHAKSSWKELNLLDHDRPLNKRGKRTAPSMGQRLANKKHQPNLIISSTAKRAWDTASIVANKINLKVKSIETNNNLFHALPNEMCKVISKCNNNIDKLMLVGHNPAMTMLSNLLLKSNRFENIPTAGLVTLSIEIIHWQDILKDGINCQLIDYDYPKLHQ